MRECRTKSAVLIFLGVAAGFGAGLTGCQPAHRTEGARASQWPDAAGGVRRGSETLFLASTGEGAMDADTTDGSRRDRALSLAVAPAYLRDEAWLTEDRPDLGNPQYLYLGRRAGDQFLFFRPQSAGGGYSSGFGGGWRRGPYGGHHGVFYGPGVFFQGGN